MKNKPSHFAIYIDDMKRASSFYSALFDWDFVEYGPPEFRQIKSADSQLIGALQERKFSPISDKVIGYECTIEVENLDRTIGLIEKNGGKIVLTKVEIPGVGWIAKFLDTEGNLACVMEYQKE